jgi:hypothetical protein
MVNESLLNFQMISAEDSKFRKSHGSTFSFKDNLKG